MLKKIRWRRWLVALTAVFLITLCAIPVGYLVSTQPLFNRPAAPLTFVRWDTLPTPTVTQPQWTSYTHSAPVNDLLRRDGILWIASDGGLIAQAGGHSVQFRSEHGLADNRVTALAIGRDNSLWIATASGGVSQFNGRSFTTFTTADGLPDNRVRDITVTDDGSVWIATASGLGRYNGRRWTTHDRFNTLLGLPSNNIRAVAAVPGSSALWVATDAGLGVFDGRSWETVARSNGGLSSNNTFTVDVADDGTVWVGHEAGLERFDGSRWTHYLPADGLIAPEVTAVVALSSSEAWVGYGSFGTGVSHVQDNGGSVTITTQTDHAINAILADSGDLFLATSSGLSQQIAPGNWQPLDLPSELPSPAISSIIAARSAIWLGSNGGVSWFNGRSFQTFTTADGLSSNDVRHLAVGPDQTPYAAFAVAGMGMSRFNSSGTWDSVPCTVSAPPSLNIYAVRRAPDGSLWIATNSGIARYTDQQHHIFTTFHGLPDDRVLDLAIGDDGRIIAATMSGIAAYANDAWTTLIPGEANRLAVSPDGTIWAIMGENLVVWENGRSRTIANLNPRSVGSLVASNDALWLGTTDGVAHVTRSSGHFTLYTVGDGLAFNRTPQVWLDNAGQVWSISEASANSTNGYFVPYTVAHRTLNRFDGTRWHSQLIASSQRPIHGIITDIISDPDGAVWVSTVGGISRYDGAKWTSFTVADGLINHDIYSIVTAFGGIWAASNGGVIQLVPHAGDPAIVPAHRLGWNGNDFLRLRLLNAPDGTLWASNGRSLHQFNGDSWQEIAIDNSLGDIRLETMAFDANGRLWVSASVQAEAGRAVAQPYYLGVYNGQSWRWDATQSGDQPLTAITALAFAPDGRLWGGTTNGAWVFDPQATRFATPITEYHAPIEQVTDIAFTADGDTLLSSRFASSLLRIANGPISQTAVPLPNADRAYAVHVTPAGDIWLGSNGGAARLTGETWQTFPAPTNQPEGRVLSFVREENGRVWLGTTEGQVLAWQGGELTQLPLFTDPRSSERRYLITAVQPDRDGSVWIGSFGGGLARSHMDTWQRFGSSTSLFEGTLQAFTIANGSAWLGTSSGTFVRPLQTASACTPAEVLWDDAQAATTAANQSLWFLGDGLVYFEEDGTFERGGYQALPVLATSPDGAVWFATRDGLMRHGENGRSRALVAELPPDGVPQALAISANGTIWLGTDAGLFVRSGQSWQAITAQDGLANNSIRHIAIAADDTIWLVTDGGVSHYRP